MRENTTGFFKPKSKEKTPSLDERIASDPGRAKQDMQAAKERESNKGKIIKQVADAKSESSVRSNPQYKSASTPSKIASSIPTEAPAESNVPFKGQTAKKSAPKRSTPSVQTPSQDDMDREARIKENEKFFADRGAFKDSEGMKRGGAVKSKAKSTCMKTGGMVKSGASRGDGCAIRGRTKGKYC